VGLSGLLPFAQAVSVLAQLAGLTLSTSSAWRLSQQWGQAFAQAEERARTHAQQVDTHRGVIPGEALGSERLGVGLDGFLIRVRAEGWKEVKTGCLFRVVAGTQVDPHTGEAVGGGRATETSYVAHLGGPEIFGQQVWAEAKRRGWTRARDTQVVGDGASWIWQQANEHFYDSLQVVDWYHAKSHLVQAGQLLYGEAHPALTRWLHEQETRLYQGHADGVAQTLRAAAERTDGVMRDQILTQAGYFETHQRRMDYLEMRIHGWVIGSGMVESGAKQYQARFKGPGMQWSRAGAERLLPIRTAIMSNRFEAVWKQVYNSPQN
jgi:hypothetical protein